jgi:DNA repair exonuclease SbcCD ATPase subunit
MNDIEDKARDAIRKETTEYNRRISDLTIKFNMALNSQKLMEQTIEADKRLIERCKEVDYEKELEVLRSEWPTEKFEVDESKGFCPTCGQPLPQEQWQEKSEQMRFSFNQRKEAKKKELNERAAKIKEQQAQASEELKRLEDKLSADTEQLETIKHGINCIFADKQDLEKIVIRLLTNFLQKVQSLTSCPHR